MLWPCRGQQQQRQVLLVLGRVWGLAALELLAQATARAPAVQQRSAAVVGVAGVSSCHDSCMHVAAVSSFNEQIEITGLAHHAVVTPWVCLYCM